MRAAFKIFIFYIFFICQESNALSLYKYKGLTGTIYLEDNSRINIKVKSIRELIFTDKCPDDVRNFFETLWITRHGRKAVIHLLRSKSRIYVSVTDSMGALVIDKKAYWIYAVTTPDAISLPERKNRKQKKTELKLITEYNGKQTWEVMRIQLFKGSFLYSKGDTTSFVQGKFIITDYYKRSRITGSARDSAIMQLKRMHFHFDSIDKGLIRDPTMIATRHRVLNSYFKTCREFFYLCGIHEITHTTTKNIALSRKLLDTESPAYKAEKKAKRKLKKVLKSKRLHYNSCE